MSDSDSDPSQDWTVVGASGQPGQESDSGSSCDFVQLESEDVVAYHHKTTSRSSSVESADFLDDVETAGDIELQDMNGRKPNDEVKNDDDTESISSEGKTDSLDIEVVSALTDSRQDLLSLSTAVADDSTVKSPDSESCSELLETAENLPSSSDGAEGDRLVWDENLWFWDDQVSIEPDPDLPSAEDPDNESPPLHVELSTPRLEKSQSVSSSEIEELEMPEEEEEEEDEEDEEEGDSDDYERERLHASVARLQAESAAHRGQASGSDSDFSDIVRIDPPHAPEDQEEPFGRRYFPAAADLMQVSASSNSSGSSLRSRFHFVHPIPNPQHRYVYQREEEADDANSLSGDVDDRCESDISGVAHDSDLDLSTVSYNVDDLDLLEGDVVRSYRHRPNNSLNTALTTLALLTLATTVGIGLGHYWGTMRELTRRGQQNTRMVEIQDEYLRCLRTQEILEAEITVTDHEKIAAVTAVWKQKYEELIIERVDLERTIKHLEGQIEAAPASTEMVPDSTMTRELETQLDLLRTENSELQALLSGLHTSNRVVQSEIDQLKLSQEELQRSAELEEKIQDLEAKIELIEQDWKKDTESKNQEHSVELEALQKERSSELEALRKQQSVDHEAWLKERTAELEALQKERSAELEAEVRVLQQARDESVEVETGLRTENQRLNVVVEKVMALVGGLDKAVKRSLQEDSVDPDTPEGCIQDLAGQDTVSNPELTDLVALHTSVHDLVSHNTALRRQIDTLSQDTREAVGMKDSLKEEVNRLANENEDLKATVGKLRYANQPTATDEVPVEGGDATVDANNNVHNEPSSLYESLRLLMSESKITKLLSNATDILVNATQPITDILMNATQPITDILANATQPISDQIKALKNSTADSRVVEKLTKKWVELKDTVEKSAAVIKIQKAAEDLQKYVMSQQKSDQEEELVEDEENSTTFTSVVNKLTNTTMAVAKYQEFVNKTKESVTKLSKKITKTWNKVKNLTGDYLEKNKAVRDFTKTVDKNLKNIGRSMESGWKRAQKQMVKKGWLPKTWSSEKKRKYHGKAPQQQHTTYMNDEFKTKEDVQAIVEQAQKKFSHKQKSATLDHDSYAEYWKQVEFEPDDFFEEGFFQGNNREYKKHQKRVKKLRGRLARLSEQMFLTMDDDDIDDMYEDFDEVQDDLDDVNLPETLMTWLTCQSRWWKSRLVRRHTNEDLVRGCGRHLMHWQLKVMCNPPCKKCAKKVEGPFCDYYYTVILPSAGGQKQEINHHRQAFTLTVDDKGASASGDILGKYEVNLETPLPAEEDNSTAAHDSDAGWVFERAEDRESHHHDGSWNDRRNKGRNDERNMPWYTKRADSRSDSRASRDQKQRAKHRGL